ncbi:MAG: hypothetical protein ABIQ16_22950, partial [Polyangiaceae bacterium]
LDVGLAKQPELRFASAAEYLERVDVLIAADWQTGAVNTAPRAGKKEPERAESARDLSATTVPAASGSASRVKLFTAAIALLVAIAVAVWLLYGRVRA